MGMETQVKSMEITRQSAEAPSSPDSGPNLGLLWERRWRFSCRQESFVLLLSCHVLMIPFQSNISHPESFRGEEFLEGFRKVKSVRHGFHLECISHRDLLVAVPLHNVPWKAGPASHCQRDVYMRSDRWNTIGDNQVCCKNSRCPEFSWRLF